MIDPFDDEQSPSQVVAQIAPTDTSPGASQGSQIQADLSETVTSNRTENGTLDEQLAQQKEIIRVLTQQVATTQSQLDGITRTLGWRLLSRYGRFKYHYLLPFYRLLNRIRPTEQRQPGASEDVAAGVANPGSQIMPAQSGVHDVICFPTVDWDSYQFHRSQQLLSQFARSGHRGFHLRTSFHNSGHQALTQNSAPNVYTVRLPGPSHVNLNGGKLSRRTLEGMLDALQELRSKAGVVDPVCVVELPFWAPLAFAARERWGWKIIYDCMDDHSGFSSSGPVVLRLEEALIAKSDLVVASGRILYEKVSQLARKSLLLPNAADFSHFSRPGPLRPLSELSGPIIGYYGAISEWFDVKMVREAAEARPDWQFVLIGDTVGADVSPLIRLPNVHLLGRRPYASLPSYLHQFDVACIPFLRTPLTDAADPVKFYEYLSAGKPVVAVDLPELEPHREYFYPVSSAPDFVSQIDAALRERSPERVQARIEFARQNTWEHRHATLAESINQI